MSKQELIEKAIATMEKLSSEKIAEVADFADFILKKNEDKQNSTWRPCWWHSGPVPRDRLHIAWCSPALCPAGVPHAGDRDQVCAHPVPSSGTCPAWSTVIVVRLGHFICGSSATERRRSAELMSDCAKAAED